MTADGEWRYDLTEEACLELDGRCDAECEGPRCVSFGGPGYCVFPTLDSTTCGNFAGVWVNWLPGNPVCGVFYAQDPEFCGEV